MTVTLPIINGSTGVWGGILNTAITDIDTRLETATAKNNTQDETLTTLSGKVTTLESAVTSIGAMKTFTSGARPTATVGAIGLETDTGYMVYGAKVSGIAAWVPWPGSPMARLRQTSAQAILTSDSTAIITFQVADLNRLAGWSSGGRFTAPVAGQYEISGAITYVANATGNRNAILFLNGNPVAASSGSCPGNGAGGSTAQTRPMILALNKFDYVELRGWQATGATVNTDVSNASAQSGMNVKYMGYYGA